MDDDLKDEDIEYGMALEEIEYDDEFVPRLKNHGKIQRTKITGFDQREPLVVYGLREDTIHGEDSNKMPCTLVVFRWYLHERVRGKKLKSLRISIVFATERKKGKATDPWYDPHVRDVAPDGTFSMLPSTQKVEKKNIGEGSLDVGFGGPSAGLKIGYELTRSLETVDQIRINGTPYSDYKGQEQGDVDRCNAVEWNLFENESLKSGLPTFFRTAVLLERRRGDDKHFTASFTIRAELDVLSDAQKSLKKMFGIIPKDDPVIFDPTVQEASRFDAFSKRLDAVSLENECRFVMYKVAPQHSESAKVEENVTSKKKEEA
jgi:hypothetical protein